MMWILDSLIGAMTMIVKSIGGLLLAKVKFDEPPQPRSCCNSS